VKEIYSGFDEDKSKCSVVTLGAGHSIEGDSLVWDHHEEAVACLEFEVEVLGTGSNEAVVAPGAEDQGAGFA
jgi:hypothetical protein